MAIAKESYKIIAIKFLQALRMYWTCSNQREYLKNISKAIFAQAHWIIPCKCRMQIIAFWKPKNLLKALFAAVNENLS
jgi:hypothetical protein